MGGRGILEWVTKDPSAVRRGRFAHLRCCIRRSLAMVGSRPNSSAAPAAASPFTAHPLPVALPT